MTTEARKDMCRIPLILLAGIVMACCATDSSFIQIGRSFAPSDCFTQDLAVGIDHQPNPKDHGNGARAIHDPVDSGWQGADPF